MNSLHQFVVLLRGINVGGNNKVDMKQLTAACEQAGYQDVTTYLNTGNIVLRTEIAGTREVEKNIHALMQNVFGLDISVLVLSTDKLTQIAHAIPSEWVNDTDTMKADVMFLWSAIDSPDIIESLPITDGIDTVIYTPGAILWSIPRDLQTKSKMVKLVGTKLYTQITVRNVNTVRKLAMKIKA